MICSLFCAPRLLSTFVKRLRRNRISHLFLSSPSFKDARPSGMRRRSARLRRAPLRRRSGPLLQRLETRRLLAVSATTASFVLPPVADPAAELGVIDVTRWSEDPALNANPDVGNNDRPALQAAIDAALGSRQMLYLPAGTYEIDGPLNMPILSSNRASAYTVLQGENRDETIIKLADNVGLDGPVIQFNIATADAFRNAVRDLTIDVGSGNPLADGLRFTGNNQATVRNVHIRSSDPDHAGDVGLELGTGENGPLLIENVSVDGFDIGIRTAIQTASQTFEDIYLTNQQVYGWVNEADQNVFVRNLTSQNAVRAIHNFPLRIGQNAVFTIVDSTLRGVGEASGETAILTEERLFARNVTTPGYQSSVRYQQANGFLAGNRNLAGNIIEEYWSEGTQTRKTGGTFELFEGSPDATLGIKPKDAPEAIAETDFAMWAKPQSFVTTNPDGSPSGLAGDLHDDSLAIQAAIDSGAQTIYFPNLGSYVVESNVVISGPVQRLLGLASRLTSLTGDGKFIVEAGDSDALLIERFAGGGTSLPAWEHASDRTLVVRNMQGFEYEPTATRPGDLYLYDVVHGSLAFRNQDVYARQLNVEARADVNDASLPDQKILNDNANLWVLGLKIENQGTIVRTVNGGHSEILGVYRNNSNFSDADNPAFVTVDSATSVVNFDAATAASNAYAVWASETRNGVTRTSERFGGGHVYSAFDRETHFDVTGQWILDNADPEATYEGVWETSATLPGGYLDEDVRFSNDPAASATFTTELPLVGDYAVDVRWIDNYGGQNHNGHSAAVPIEVEHANGQSSFAVDQRGGGGRWSELGTFGFGPGQAAEVVFGTDGTSAKTIVDGVRFRYLGDRTDSPPLKSRDPLHLGGQVYEDGFVAGIRTSVSAREGLLREHHSGASGCPVHVASVQAGIGGRIEIQEDGGFVYDAHDFFAGWDTFRYVVSDGVRTTTAFARVFVAPAIDPISGTPNREPTELERLESASAAIEVQPISSTADGPAALFGPGLSVDTLVVGGGDAVAHVRDGNAVHFHSEINDQIVVDLGGLYRLQTTRVWNFNQSDEDRFFTRRTPSGTRQLKISVDEDADGNGQPDGFVDASVITMAEASGRTDYGGELFGLDGVRARFVRVEMVDGLGDSGSSGLSEIQFRGDRVEESASPRIPNVFVQDVSSEANADRRAVRTLGAGYDSANNTHNGSVRGTNWESAAADPNPTVTYDLSGVHDLGSMRIWNYNFAGQLELGAKTIAIETSVDGQTFAPERSIDLPIGSGSPHANGHAVDLTGIRARYVRLGVTSTHGGQSQAGLAEVQFFGDAVDIGNLVPVVASQTSNLNGAGGLVRTHDGSGLSDDGTTHDAFSANRYTSNFDSTPTLTFELAETVDLQHVRLWNFTAAGESDRGIRRFRLETSVDGSEFEDAGVYQIDRGGSQSTFYDGVWFLDAAKTARFVRMEVLENWGDTSFTGLGEIAFFGVSVQLPPTDVRLAPESDSGPSNTDGVTHRNNANASVAVSMIVDGVRPGDSVALWRDDRVVGTAIANAESVVVHLDPTVTLAEGIHRFVATRKDLSAILPSMPSAPVQVIVDTTAPILSRGPLLPGASVRSIDFSLTEPVDGLDLDDLIFTLGGTPIDLNESALIPKPDGGRTLLASDEVFWQSGRYGIDVAASVTDLAGNPIVSEASNGFELGPIERAYSRSTPSAATVVPHEARFEQASMRIALEAKPTNVRRGTLFSKDHIGFGDGGHVTVYLRSGRLFARLQTQTESLLLRGGMVSEGIWQTIELRFGHSGIELSLDGVVVDSSPIAFGWSATGGYVNRENIVIGASKIRSAAGTDESLRDGFTGLIRDFRMTDGEGTILFAEAIPPRDSQTASWFDGVDDFLVIEHEPSQPLDAGTIDLTFRAADLRGRQTLLSKDAFGRSEGHLRIRLHGDRIEVRMQTADQTRTLRGGLVTEGQQHELQLAFGGGIVELRLDNHLAARADFDWTLRDNTLDWVMGADTAARRSDDLRLSGHFHGHIGGFSIAGAGGEST